MWRSCKLPSLKRRGGCAIKSLERRRRGGHFETSRNDHPASQALRARHPSFARRGIHHTLGSMSLPLLLISVFLQTSFETTIDHAFALVHNNDWSGAASALD